MSLPRRLFITGTDTEVGKTLFTSALIHALQNAGERVQAFKPVAAGCELIDAAWRNDDALRLQRALNYSCDYASINPIALKAAIAPHLAAAEQGIELSVRQLMKACPLPVSNWVLVEGAGGWLVPLNDHETFADYAKAEGLEVILVVGMKLGCINHALLSAQSIRAMGLNLAGWVANHIDPRMQRQAQNLATLQRALNCPLLAEIPHLLSEESNYLGEIAAKYVKIAALSH